MSETSQNKKPNEKEGSGLGFFKCKKRDRGATEEKLLSAGLEVFSKYGFNGSTTKMIAKKADMNESLIGRYFDGKEGLLIAITQKFITEMIHRELQYPPQNSLSEELNHYVTERLNDGCVFEDFAKLIISQALVDKNFKKRIHASHTLHLDEKLVERIQRLADLGKLAPGTVVLELCQDIDTYMDGIFFFDRILHETPQAELKARVLSFVNRYSKFFENK